MHKLILLYNIINGFATQYLCDWTVEWPFWFYKKKKNSPTFSSFKKAFLQEFKNSSVKHQMICTILEHIDVI